MVDWLSYSLFKRNQVHPIRFSNSNQETGNNRRIPLDSCAEPLFSNIKLRKKKKKYPPPPFSCRPHPICARRSSSFCFSAPAATQQGARGWRSHQGSNGGSKRRERRRSRRALSLRRHETIGFAAQRYCRTSNEWIWQLNVHIWSNSQPIDFSPLTHPQIFFTVSFLMPIYWKYNYKTQWIIDNGGFFSPRRFSSTLELFNNFSLAKDNAIATLA